MARNRVKVVDGLRDLSEEALRASYRSDRAASRLDNDTFDAVVRWGIEQGEMHSLGYRVDLPVKAGDFSPLAVAVAARVLAIYTRGAKTGPIAAPKYPGKGIAA